MSDGKFYQVLGISSSASAEQIKAAYRELVKRHHPDLFDTAKAKAQATEKLRQINEAYAVLGNPERRRRYDQAAVQPPRTPPRPRSRAAGRQAPPRRPQQAAPRRPAFKFPDIPWRFSKRWAGLALAAAGLIFVLDYAGRSVPRLVSFWVLLEKLEVSLPATAPSAGADTGWVRIGEYASVEECAAVIKQKVRHDESEGSEAVYDERRGTMAITLQIRKEAGRGRSGTPGAPETPEDVTKRVRTLECRTAQRVVMESRFHRALRSLGLAS
jgi:hypothetical protein